ncbi:hypothetical protein AKJ09_02434 [Labilithrix luteola]|uniref:Uncharacterized protein n=1 Tax=Labilithrix luteola TaxID=1391654 RepID=A0A0K1PQF4_9BACT|nr:hypothetical protein [Labilithrix luteola]AKU95770.1 hypothetical protein AKJ09_02434 [Labilithrix luteola]
MDQALFLALSVMSEVDADAFIEAVIDTDLALALNASKYMEYGRDAVVSRLLTEVLSRAPGRQLFEDQLESALERGVETSRIHIPLLRELMKTGNMLAAAAVQQLVKLEGASSKRELFEELYTNRHDYNYCCNGIVKALLPHLEVTDIAAILELVERAEKLPEEETESEVAEEDVAGLVSACGQLLVRFEVDAIRSAFLPGGTTAPISRVRADVLCRLLIDRYSTSTLILAGELLLAGVVSAATSIWFISRFAKEELSWSSFDVRHVDRLLEMIRSGEKLGWPVRALYALCRNRPDLAERLATLPRSSSVVCDAIVLFCRSNDDELAFDVLRQLVGLSAEQRHHEPLHFVAQLDLSWKRTGKLLIDLLKLRDATVAGPVLERALDEEVAGVELGPIGWWTDWLVESASDGDEHAWFADRLSRFLVAHMSADQKSRLVASFADVGVVYKRVLARTVFMRMSDLSSDAFAETELLFLIDELHVPADSFYGHLLGGIATERFVIERLVPIVTSEASRFQKNLRAVIRTAGLRHGRRYLSRS